MNLPAYPSNLNWGKGEKREMEYSMLNYLYTRPEVITWTPLGPGGPIGPTCPLSPFAKERINIILRQSNLVDKIKALSLWSEHREINVSTC